MTGEAPASLADLLFPRPGEPAGDDEAVLVHVDDRAWARGWVRTRAQSVADAMGAAGVVAGDRVGVMLPNGVDVVATLFGAWRAGATYVPLNPRLTDGEVGHILASVGPAAVVTTPGDAARFPGLPVVALAAPDEAPDVRSPAPSRRGEAAGASDVALVQFTSGTTGRPKPVLLTHSGVTELLDGVIRKLRAGSPTGSAPTGSAPAGSAPTAPPRPPMPNLVPVSLSLWAGLYNVLFALRVGARWW